MMIKQARCNVVLILVQDFSQYYCWNKTIALH